MPFYICRNSVNTRWIYFFIYILIFFQVFLSSHAQETLKNGETTARPNVNATCKDCILLVDTSQNFLNDFQKLDISKESLTRPNCIPSGTLSIRGSRSYWSLLDNISGDNSCMFQNTFIPCDRTSDGNTSVIISLNSEQIMELLEISNEAKLEIQIYNVSFPLPGKFGKGATTLELIFTGSSECFLDVEARSSLTPVISRISSSDTTIAGEFHDAILKSSSSVAGEISTITMEMISGGIILPSYFFVLQVRETSWSEFKLLIEQAENPQLLVERGNQAVDLELMIGTDNTAQFLIPENSAIDIDYNDKISLTFDNFPNPSTNTIGDWWLSLWYNASITDLTTNTQTFKNQRAIYATKFITFVVGHAGAKAAILDIISAVLFGLCFLFAVFMVIVNKLRFVFATIWTDMVVIAALFSFACGLFASLVWVFYASKTHLYWTAAQYFFTTLMILSLCFHWATVLSFKMFKKLKKTSPVVIGYLVANVSVAALIITAVWSWKDDIECVYSGVKKCVTSNECLEPVSAEGNRIRFEMQTCGMEQYYLYLGSALVVYTLLLMILGCMVMRKGRTLMLKEAPTESRIWKSLTVFYAIIATTCVLYISAQIIFIAEFLTEARSRGEKNTLDDFIWYLFIVWLPQSLPPLLLLFLQWNPNTVRNSDAGIVGASTHDHSIDRSSKDDEIDSPHSFAGGAYAQFSKDHRTKSGNSQSLSMRDTLLLGHADESGSTQLRLMVRLTLPLQFERTCFVSLDFFTHEGAITPTASLQKICAGASWKRVGATEPVSNGTQDNVHSYTNRRAKTNPNERSSKTYVHSYVEVLEVPVIGAASNTLLRFRVHASILGNRALTAANQTKQLFSSGQQVEGITNFPSTTSTSTISTDDEFPSASVTGPLSTYDIKMFEPVLEFMTSSRAVLDAAASGQPLNLTPSDDRMASVADPLASSLATYSPLDQLSASLNPASLTELSALAELSVSTAMVPGEVPNKDDKASSHRHMGNLIRYFQYDSDNGIGGLVVEDLQESIYSNVVPRQLLELLAVRCQEQVDQARNDLAIFSRMKWDKLDHGVYGTLVQSIHDEGELTVARAWLENRLKNRKEYLSMLRKNIQYLVSRDKHKQYFKASVDKKVQELRFVPTNMHIQDLLIGPTSAFVDETKRSTKDVAAYDFTTVGAFAAHIYKFNKGGILSYQEKLKKMRETLKKQDIDFTRWPEEARTYDDCLWDMNLRLDVAFSQALAALTCSFVRKIEIAIQNPDPRKGSDMLWQLSKLGFLFQVESLLSTHGKEIGMLEDLAGAVTHLSNVSFVLQDVTDKPASRFSFRMSRKKDPTQSIEEACVVKIGVTQKLSKYESGSPGSSPRTTTDLLNTPRPPKYVVTVQLMTAEVTLPETLASGGFINVTPLLFTQGINEMQTIANNTERAKTELQDMINVHNLKPLKKFCEKYSRLATEIPLYTKDYLNTSQTPYNSMKQALMIMSEQEVSEEYRQLEEAVMDAARAIVKVKRPDILQRSSDLCRELGGGRVTICKSAKDRTAMSVTYEQVRILQRHHQLPANRVPATVSVMRSHGVRIENALKNTGKRMFAFNKLQRSLLPEEYRCPDQVGGHGNVS